MNKPLLSNRLKVQPVDQRAFINPNMSGIPQQSSYLGIVGVNKGLQRISYKEQGMRAQKKKIEKLTELVVNNINRAERQWTHIELMQRKQLDDRKFSLESISIPDGSHADDSSNNVATTVYMHKSPSFKKGGSRFESIDSTDHMIARTATLKLPTEGAEASDASPLYYRKIVLG